MALEQPDYVDCLAVFTRLSLIDMDFNPVILAIPMYFTLMAVELVYESITKRKTYRLNDSITNINSGVLQQLFNTFTALFKIALYTIVYEHWAIMELGKGWLVFAIAMLLWDFCYYWSHRMAHRVNLFWGGHVVHHQSEEYNLSVALRQTSTGFIWGFPFYVPMAIIGIDPVYFALAGGFNLLYQFWIHTEHIGRMPAWFEAVFNTPSHHRVHHGRDPKYLDKNYAGILIIWDRMFGSFKREEEKPNYGTTKPLKSWNPIYANVAHYFDLFQVVKKVRSAPDAAKVLFNPPGWQPEYMGGQHIPQEVPKEYKKYDRTQGRLNAYLLAQFLIFLALNANYFFTQAGYLWEVKVGYAAWILFSAVLFSFLFERSGKWVVGLEVVRVLMIPAGLFAMQAVQGNLPSWMPIAGSAIALASLFWLLIAMRKSGKKVVD